MSDVCECACLVLNWCKRSVCANNTDESCVVPLPSHCYHFWFAKIALFVKILKYLLTNHYISPPLRSTSCDVHVINNESFATFPQVTSDDSVMNPVTSGAAGNKVSSVGV